MAVFIALTSIVLPPYAAAQNRGSVAGAESDNGLRVWRWEGHGVLLELTQRLPDQTRGYFEARGFAPTLADEIAHSCFFQSVFQNTVRPGGGSVEFDLGEWRAIHNGGHTRMRLREHWERLWSQRPVSAAARIAFEWSLMPTRQQYAPGEYNWGMTVYGLPAGTVFNLEFSWYRDGRRFVHTLDAIECAPDVRMDPA